MSTKYTPGPWVAVAAQFETDTVSFAAYVHGAANKSGGFPIVADIPKRTKDGDHMANARLIAAAPDLYEALVKCEKALHRYWVEVGEDGNEAIDAAKAAIAKATGK